MPEVGVEITGDGSGQSGVLITGNGGGLGGRGGIRVHSLPDGTNDQTHSGHTYGPKRAELGYQLDGAAAPSRAGLEVYYPNGQVMARLGEMPGMRFSEDFEDTTYNVAISGTWARNNTRAHSGSWSFKSATIGNSATTDAVVTVPTGATSMSFWWFTDTEPGFDGLSVLFNGVATPFYVSGQSTSWSQSNLDVTGVSTVTFRYQKDSSTSTGADAVWIDDLTFFSSDTGRVGMEICDETGTVKVLAGELTDGDYGLAVVNDLGQLTKLGDFVFGPQADYATTSTTLDSATYINPTDGAGPNVQVVVGETGRLLVTFGCQMTLTTASGTAPRGGAMSVYMTGANTLSTSNEYSLVFATNAASVTPTIFRASYTHFFTGLNPGLTSIYCRYRTPYAGNCDFADRTLIAQPF